MGTAGRKLPKVRREHLNSLRIENETRYDTRAIRTYAIRCLRALNLQVRGVIRVAYTNKRRVAGAAAIGGERVFQSGLNMVMLMPRDPGKLDVASFARVLHHEALHWRGVRHEDMTDDQRYC